MPDPNPAIVRDLLTNAVAQCPDAPICLSGGIDSASILFASLDLGRRPECVTFQLGPNPSQDLRVARSITRHYNLPLIIASIPQTPDTLVHDVHRLISLINHDFPKRTHVQCLHPFLYMTETITSLGYHDALIGMAAEDTYGTMRDVAIVRRRDGEDAARQLRIAHFTDPDVSDHTIRRVCHDHLGVTLHDPYRDPAYAQHILSLDMADLHSPKEKAIMIKAFHDHFSNGQWFRLHGNLQVVSGIRAWHDTLLDSPLNTNQNRDVRGIYNRIRKESSLAS